MTFQEYKKIIENKYKEVTEYEVDTVGQQFGLLILEERLKRGLTQAELAKLVGIRQVNIARWESCDDVITGKSMDKIAKVLGVRIKITFEKKDESPEAIRQIKNNTLDK